MYFAPEHCVRQNLICDIRWNPEFGLVFSTTINIQIAESKFRVESA
jgi:hypothetical protein